MKILKYVLHAAILIGVVIAGIRYLNSEAVIEALLTFDPWYGVLVLLVPALQLALKSWRFEVLMRPLGGTERSTVMRAYAAGQPATLLPGGIAARIGLMHQANVPVATSSAAVLLSSLYDQAVFVLGLMVTALWFPDARRPALWVLGVIAVLLLLLLVPAVRRPLRRLALRILARFGFADAAEDFGWALRRTLASRVVLAAFALSLAAFLSDVLLLEFSLRGVGWEVPLRQVFLAYLLPTMLGRLSALPAGGIGLAEAGIVGYLVGVAGLGTSAAAVAAAVFRVSTVFLQALYGALVYWLWWRGEEERAMPPTAEAA